MTRTTSRGAYLDDSSQGDAWFQAIMQSVDDSVIVVDAAGRVVDVNRAAEELFGYPRADLVGELVEVLLPEAARAVHRGERDAYRRAPAPRPMGTGLELVARRRSGERLAVDVSLSPVPGDRDEVVAIVRDMSGRRQEELRLGHHAAIVESCGDAVYSQDGDGTVTGWNPAARALFGYEPDEVIGWRSTRLSPEDRWADHELLLRRVLAGETLGQVEADILRKDGVIIPAVLTMTPIRDGRRRVIGASVIARDVSDQRLALATLAESEARLREVEAWANVGGWVLDVATGSVQWSEELHRIHGIDPDDFDGTLDGVAAFVHPDDRGRAVDLRTALAGSSVVEGEYRIVRPDGAVRRLRVRAEPVVSGQGRVIGLRGICRDVTDRDDEAGGAPTAPAGEGGAVGDRAVGSPNTVGPAAGVEHGSR